MIPIERQKKLLQLISNNGLASISELATSLNVSHMTIRRDIQKLEEKGKVTSVSGGVQLLEKLAIEPTHQDKSQLFHSEKENIGAYAATLIEPGSAIYLDAGTTTLEIAHNLTERSDILVVTNDFVIANYLINYGSCQIIHTGGSVCKANFSCVGELASHILRVISLDIAFISTSSWNLRGLSTPDETKIPVKKAILQSATKNILVTDSSKYGKRATFYLYPLTELDQIICDDGLVKNVQESIEDLGIKLSLV